MDFQVIQRWRTVHFVIGHLAGNRRDRTLISSEMCLKSDQSHRSVDLSFRKNEVFFKTANPWIVKAKFPFSMPPSRWSSTGQRHRLTCPEPVQSNHHDGGLKQNSRSPASNGQPKQNRVLLYFSSRLDVELMYTSHIYLLVYAMNGNS